MSALPAPATPATTPAPPKKRAPPFGEIGCEFGLLRVQHPLVMTLGTFDELEVKPPTAKRYALAADSIVSTETGLLVTLTQDPEVPRPAFVLVPWANVTHAFPPAPPESP